MRAKRRQPSRTRRWLSRRGLWMPALPWKEGPGAPPGAGGGGAGRTPGLAQEPWVDTARMY